jgi:hypothetical protein
LIFSETLQSIDQILKKTPSKIAIASDLKRFVTEFVCERNSLSTHRIWRRCVPMLCLVSYFKRKAEKMATVSSHESAQSNLVKLPYRQKYLPFIYFSHKLCRVPIVAMKEIIQDCLHEKLTGKQYEVS